MDHATQVSLTRELLALKDEGTHFCDSSASTSPVEHYLSPDRFEQERERIFLVQPHAAAHSSELPQAGSFLRRAVFGKPVLLTRDKEGTVRAFLNVCRHRGAQLVAEDSGCLHRFSCPYHAWTYSSAGKLLAAPHFGEGFPDLDKSELGLTQLPCREAFGFVWVIPTAGAETPINGFLDDMAEDLVDLDLGEHHIAVEDTIEVAANWKILVEGGIESYHFKVAHRDTIGPFFEDNLSSYQCFGRHMRSILPRSSMTQLVDTPTDTWRLRDHANVIYTFFPSSQLLVQQDHFVWIRSTPMSPERTELRLATMVPRTDPNSQQKDETYWRRNHAITMTTLREDFEIGEGIQRGLATGANTHLHFGRFEGALEKFNQAVEGCLRA